MSKPRQAIDHPSFPADDLRQLRAECNALLADQNGTNLGIYPVE